jgi:carbonic anhydrase/acetyltransferase-like protein (isoleucine patch superfamily)
MAIRPYKKVLPRVAVSAYVDEAAVVIGDVEIGADSSIWPMCVLRGDVNSIRVGARSNIQDGTIVHVTHRHAGRPEGHPSVIGDDVTIGHHVTLHGCRIGHRCLIGMGSVIMDGAELQDEVLLGAGSLVTEGAKLESGYLWLGRPARRIRPITDAERDWFRYSAQNYVDLKNDYLGAT